MFSSVELPCPRHTAHLTFNAYIIQRFKHIRIKCNIFFRTFINEMFHTQLPYFKYKFVPHHLLGMIMQILHKLYSPKINKKHILYQILECYFCIKSMSIRSIVLIYDICCIHCPYCLISFSFFFIVFSFSLYFVYA